MAEVYNTPVILPIYTLLPLSTADECTEFAISLIHSLILDERYKGKEIILMGDSAGGWIVLRALERMCELALNGDNEAERAMKRLGRGIMFSPWTNLGVDDALLQAAENVSRGPSRVFPFRLLI
jgi:alpha-beta hydrolase superfamily lysophospholipase